MSWLLGVAVLLLALVVGLSLWQRSGQVDRRRAGPLPSGPAPVPRADADAAPSPRARRRDDADFGSMTWDGEMWCCERDIRVAGEEVALELAGPADGPVPSHREVARALVASSAEIDARARPMVVAELQRRGCAPEDPVPYEASVGLTDDGRVAGWLWYCFGGFEGEIGVRTEDGWRTLHLEVIE